MVSMAPVYPVQAALFPDYGINLEEMAYGGKPRGRSLDDKDKPPLLQITPVAPGSYNATAIILLSDGRRTTGDDTLEGQKWPPTAACAFTSSAWAAWATPAPCPKACPYTCSHELVTSST